MLDVWIIANITCFGEKELLFQEHGDIAKEQNESTQDGNGNCKRRYLARNNIDWHGGSANDFPFYRSKCVTMSIEDCKMKQSE